MNRRVVASIVSLLAVLLLPGVPYALDPLYDDPGFNAWRETVSAMPEEHLDPFTGGLVLSHVDIKIPGNGGLDLEIRRQFSSKSTCAMFGWFSSWWCKDAGEETWMGVGWQLHFGKIMNTSDTSQSSYAVTMADGSVHMAYYNEKKSAFVTKDYWLLELGSVPKLTLTNGTRIYFGQPGQGVTRLGICLATKIVDVAGNKIEIFYKKQYSDIIDHVIDSAGRRFDFTLGKLSDGIYERNRLESITGPGVEVHYAHKISDRGVTLLTEAAPCASYDYGNNACEPWRYTYDESMLDLTRLETPFGASISYVYDFVETYHTTFSGTHYSRNIVTKKVEDPFSADPDEARWDFKYSQLKVRDGKDWYYTEVADPCKRKTRHYYYAFDMKLSDGQMWKYGLPISKETPDETVTYSWDAAETPISSNNYAVKEMGTDSAVYVPILKKQTVERDEAKYITSYSRHDRYGNPRCVEEDGELNKRTDLEYWYNETDYIVTGKINKEVISGSYTGTFTTQNTYNSNGYITNNCRYGISTKYSYYSNGNVKQISDANGNTADIIWNNGKVSKQINPIYSISKSINDNGTVASTTNGRGYTTRYTYDTECKLTYVYPSEGACVKYSYESRLPFRNLVITKEKNGYKTRYHHDGFGRLIKAEDDRGVTTTVAYRKCGSKEYEDSNVGDRKDYDHLGRLKTVSHKDGTTIKYEYNKNKVEITNEAGSKMVLIYSSFGNPAERLLTEVIDSDKTSTKYTYNILGSLTSINHNNGILERYYTYDGMNFLVSDKSSERGLVNYIRDNIGNITSITDKSGKVTFEYDSINRIVSIKNGIQTYSISYDNSDNKIQVNGSGFKICQEFDSLNRPVSRDLTYDGTSYNITYKYNDSGTISSVKYPYIGAIGYEYNDNNQISKISYKDKWRLHSFRYGDSGTSTGAPLGFKCSNGIATSMSYSSRNLIQNVTVSPNVMELAYSYDASGNAASIKDKVLNRGQSMNYDSLNRLTGHEGPWGSIKYDYDTIGNRIAQSADGRMAFYSFEGSRLAAGMSDDGFEVRYSPSGDVTYLSHNGNIKEMTYDPLHNLISSKFRSVNSARLPLQGQITIDSKYIYDDTKLRIVKKSDSGTFVYFHDQEGKLISKIEQGDNGGIARVYNYIYNNGKLVARVNRSGNTQFYHTDPAGTPLAMTNEDGEVVWRALDKAFGDDYILKDSQLKNEYRLAGKEKDEETGLCYFNSRYMEPGLGRFLGTDPIGAVDAKTGKPNEAILSDPQRLNWYAYGLNNPYRYVDSDGKQPLMLLALAGLYLLNNPDVANAPSALDTPGDSEGAQSMMIDGAIGIGVGAAVGKVAKMVVGKGTEIVQRAMSKAELEATQATGLLRGGREGTHYVSDAVNNTATRAQQRLALPVRPEVRVTMEVPAGRFTAPSKVQPFEVRPKKTLPPKGILPGGGMERMAEGDMPVKILDVLEY